jgi:hypothetical protein
MHRIARTIPRLSLKPKGSVQCDTTYSCCSPTHASACNACNAYTKQEKLNLMWEQGDRVVYLSRTPKARQILIQKYFIWNFHLQCINVHIHSYAIDETCLTTRSKSSCGKFFFFFLQNSFSLSPLNWNGALKLLCSSSSKNRA